MPDLIIKYDVAGSPSITIGSSYLNYCVTITPAIASFWSEFIQSKKLIESINVLFSWNSRYTNSSTAFLKVDLSIPHR